MEFALADVPATICATLRRTVRNARIFPNNALGSYDPVNQVVTLAAIESRHIPLIQAGDFELGTKYTSLLMHETRHWHDHVGTVWGRKQLLRIYDALNARHNDDPEEFWRIPAVFRELWRDAYSTYFTTVTPNVPPATRERRWRYQFTLGRRFDLEGRLRPDMPIILTRFHTANNELACRCPFSVESLLETGAVADELSMKLGNVLGLEDPIAKHIESDRLDEAMFRRLYDPELARYSIAAHAVANVMGLADVTKTLSIASALAVTCLNLTDELIDRVKVPAGLYEGIPMWKDVSTPAAAHQLFLKARDRAYLFVALLDHGRGKSTDDISGWINQTLEASGVGSAALARDAALTEMRQDLDGVTDGPFSDRARGLAITGASLFAARSITGRDFTVFDSIRSGRYLAPTLLGDDKLLSIGQFKNPDAVQRLVERLHLTSKLQDQMREFLSTCGV